ncbi:hypothetical protein H5P28_18210 [Ruficoccus amylovorans]|uniref:Uncharacterized protein n=1 Tax=Ruficoccus amylovorans TaxID=1804625 RepID=A0A842HL04_9BACT|nr:hypothetical protein [Ruficoccus amylovorans]MBC2596206.1 hypothetical protein [Ruficoccus amylovorans]
MDTSNPFYGFTEEAFTRWYEQRSVDYQIEREYFEGLTPMPSKQGFIRGESRGTARKSSRGAELVSAAGRGAEKLDRQPV